MTILRPYPKYKPSGIDWLEEVPAHWSILPLRRVASVIASNVDKHIVEGEIPVSLCNYTDVYYNRHITSDIEFSKGTVSPEELARFQLLPGDVLITKDSESWDDIAVPAVVIDALPNVVCGYHLSRIRPDPVLDGRFLAYWIGSEDGAIHFKVLANGVTRFGLGANAIKSAGVPLPPLDEQRAIADFLDAMNEKIARFIAARRRMIAVLEEQKGAIINQAVTRGLDPDVPLKPSGIDWLGDIPAHWEILPLGRLVKIAGGMTPSKSNVGYWTGTVPWISPKDMKSSRITSAVDYISEQAVRETGLAIVPLQSILIVVRGMILARKVPVAVTEIPLTINQDMKALISKPAIDPNFLARQLEVAQDALFPLIDEAGHGTRRLPTPALLGLQLPVPSKGEQAGIVAHIDNATSTISETIARHWREIELMQEYRTRLISDVVTGTLDVRNLDFRILKKSGNALVDLTLADKTADEEVIGAGPAQ